MADLSCIAVPTGNALASQRPIFRENCLNFRPSSAAEKVSIVCGTNNHVKSEMLSNRHTHSHTQTHRPSTVTLAAHARRGLIMESHSRNSSCYYILQLYCCGYCWMSYQSSVVSRQMRLSLKYTIYIALKAPLLHLLHIYMVHKSFPVGEPT